MGAKHSKREATDGGCSSPAPTKGSPSSRVARTRSLPIRGFASKLDGAAAAAADGSLLFRRRISHDELMLRQQLEEHQALIAAFERDSSGGGGIQDVDDQETTAAAAAAPAVKEKFLGFCSGKKHDIAPNCIVISSSSSFHGEGLQQEEEALQKNENCAQECGRDDVHHAVDFVSALPAAVATAELAPSRSPEQRDDDSSSHGIPSQCDVHPSAGSAEKLFHSTLEDDVVENGLIPAWKSCAPEEEIHSRRTLSLKKELFAVDIISEDGGEYPPEVACSSEYSGTHYRFQAQKELKRSRPQKQKQKLVVTQELEPTESSSCRDLELTEDDMGSKGKMSLSFNSGKRPKDLQRSSFSDGSEVSWGSFSGKRMKDGLAPEEQSPGLSDIHPDAFAWGLMGHSDPFLGFDAAGFFSQHSELEDRMKGGQRTRTPRKSARGRATARKTRGLRASPKPVSSLESCLQAQLLDERDRERGRRVSRPLNFSALPDIRVEYNGDVNRTDYTAGNFSSLDAGQSNDGLVKRYKGTSTGTELGETFNLAGLIPLPRYQKATSSADLSATHVSDDRSDVVKGTEPSLVVDGHGIPLAGQKWWNKALLPLTLKELKISAIHQVLSTVSGQDARSGHAEDLAMSPLEGLLFSCGVGAGVMSATNANRVEVERLSQLLKEVQCQVEDLKTELEMGAHMPDQNERAHNVQPVLAADFNEVDRPPVGEEAGRTLTTPPVTSSQGDGRNSTHRDGHDEMLSEDHESIRSVATMNSSLLQGDQMAELEAELEAELDQLTGGDSVVLQQRISVFDDTEEEIDDDDYSAPAEPVHMNNYAVSPRELTRLLLKLQATRQEELITELEEELEIAQTQLKDKEKELERWKDCVRRLTEVSLVPAFSGDETLVAARTPTGAMPITHSDRDVEGMAAVRSSLVSEDQESYHFSLQQHSGESSSFSLSELSGKRVTNVPGGGMENESHIDIADEDHEESVREAASHSENQWANDDVVCDEFLRVMSDGGVVEGAPLKEKAVPSSSTTDCKLIIEDCEIEKLLVDSVQDLREPTAAGSSVVGSNTPSVYDYSSSRVSMEDGWDNLPNNMDVGGVAAWHVKLLAPHPTRRSSFNGHESKGKQSMETEKEGSPWHSEKADWLSTAFVERARVVDSSRIASEIPDADYNSSNTPCSVKYIDMSVKPAQDIVVISADEYGESDGLCCAAGSKSPSCEASLEQFLKTPPREVEPEQHTLYVMERKTVELSLTVLDKIAHWEGLMEGETPGPIMGSDYWECQSRASELEQQCILDSSYEDADVFGEDNLVLEAEEMFGRMLITQIVEKTRRGSHIVKNAQTMLATFEKDKTGNAGDTCSLQMPLTDGRGESGAVPKLAKPPQPQDDNLAKPETGVTTADEQEAVRAEYDLLGRVTLRSKDKRAPESLKDRPGKDPSYMARLDMEQIPVLDLGENSQFVQGSESYGVRDMVLHDIVCGGQPVGSSRDARPRGTVADSANKNEIMLSHRDVHREVYGGSGYREDEVHSRRRL